jgi:hypothetical protein
MVDIFPFPSTPSSTPEGQIKDILNYLIQFKETLEFALNNITIDNLSQDLITKLNTLGADIEQNKEDRDDQITQMSVKSLTVSDVVNSGIFEASVIAMISKIDFSVNFETGNLEYATSL